MIRFFTSTAYHPTALLRRTGMVDEAFVSGVWRPTTSIMEWMAGNDDFVDEITEAEAKGFAELDDRLDLLDDEQQ